MVYTIGKTRRSAVLKAIVETLSEQMEPTANSFESRRKNIAPPTFQDFPNGALRRHALNRLNNRRNKNRPCKLLRRIKTTC